MVQQSTAPTEAQLKQLLAAIRLRSTWGKRTYLMILFLCHTGLRISEMTCLEVRHVVAHGRVQDELFLSPKMGTKTEFAARVLPLNSKARECIAKLLEFNRERGFSVEERAPLFPWKNHQALPIREAEREIQKLREEAGLSAKITPHSFRHYFGTKLQQAGVDAYTIKTLMGHKDITSTDTYFNTSEERRRRAVALLVGERRAS